MVVVARYYTDPLCPHSWALEPMLRRLEVVFAGSLRVEPVPVGLYRDPPRDAGEALARARSLLDAAAATGMPADARTWLGDAPPRSSHPACLAVCAALDLDPLRAPRLLRRLREAALCELRPADSVPALCDLAAEVGYGRDAFARALESNATLERFGTAIEEARAAAAGARPVPASGRGGEGTADVPGPLLELRAPGGGCDVMRLTATAAAGAGAPAPGAAVAGDALATALAERLRVAGAEPAERPAGVTELLARFGSLAAPEVAACLDLPLPRAWAELWREVAEWRARPVAVGAGSWLFRAA